MQRAKHPIELLRSRGWFAVFVPALLVFCQAVAAQSVPISPAETDSGKYLEHIVPYVPTPMLVVQRMLEVAKVQPDDVVYDLGSGDGRIVIMAAQQYRAVATGIELDLDLVRLSTAKIRQLGLGGTATIIYGDILKQDYSSADLITVYLLPDSNLKLRPILDAQLKAGTRIVAHDFPIGGWAPVKEVTIADDGEGRSHTLYLYIHPSARAATFGMAREFAGVRQPGRRTPHRG